MYGSTVCAECVGKWSEVRPSEVNWKEGREGDASGRLYMYDVYITELIYTEPIDYMRVFVISCGEIVLENDYLDL